MSTTMFNPDRIRKDFPILQNHSGTNGFSYLDSTATALKPARVIAAVNEYYTSYSANVFRGIYRISEKATAAYEQARQKVAGFIGCSDPREIIFTRNATESLNLVAASLVDNLIGAGDQICTTIMEHHSNFVPWQQICQKKGALLKIADITDNRESDYSVLEGLINRKTRVLTITSASNVLGTILDVKRIVKHVRSVNPKCIVIVDAAQSIPHAPVNVQEWDADFIVFSGHKMMAPTGIGVLWGRYAHLDTMTPYQFGGDMIAEVHRDHTVFNSLPHRFEAGTPHIAGVIGLGAAVEYLSEMGMENVRKHEMDITSYALEKLSSLDGITLYGPLDAGKRGGIVSFTVSGVHPHDVAQVLDDENVCVRVGYHCAQPLHEFIGSGPTVRASFYAYTNGQDIDMLIRGLKRVRKIFG